MPIARSYRDARGWSVWSASVRTRRGSHWPNIDKTELPVLMTHARFVAFVPVACPAFVVMRGSDVLCDALGDLPASEIRRLLESVLDAQSAAQRTGVSLPFSSNQRIASLIAGSSGEMV